VKIIVNQSDSSVGGGMMNGVSRVYCIGLHDLFRTNPNPRTDILQYSSNRYMNTNIEQCDNYALERVI
jgi:hypothetical protein